MKEQYTRPLPPPSRRAAQVRDMAFLSMFSALIFLLAFTPLGLIDLPVIKATVLHVPVILGSVLLGPRKGAFLGGMFGLASLVKNTLMPGLSSFVFSPLLPVPGAQVGSPWALAVCFVPRILVGVTPWLVYALWRSLPLGRTSGGRGVGLGLAAAVGALTNTGLVLAGIGVLFARSFAQAQGIPVDQLLGFLMGIVAANGLPEAVVAVVIVPAVALPLLHALKLEPRPLVGRQEV